MAGGKGIVINISGSGEGAAEALRQIEAKMQETAERGEAYGERLSAAQNRINSELEHTVPRAAAASGAVRELEGNLPIRAMERFLSDTLHLGPALQAAFPLIGAIAFGGMILETVEKIKKMVEASDQAAESIQRAWNSVNLELRRSIGEVETATDRTIAETDKLLGHPGAHSLRLAFDDAREGADKLSRAIEDDIRKMDELASKKENHIGAWASFFTGHAPTSESEGVVSQAVKDIQSVSDAQDAFIDQVAQTGNQKDLQNASETRMVHLQEVYTKATQSILAQLNKVKGDQTYRDQAANVALLSAALQNLDLQQRHIGATYAETQAEIRKAQVEGHAGAAGVAGSGVDDSIRGMLGPGSLSALRARLHDEWAEAVQIDQEEAQKAWDTLAAAQQKTAETVLAAKLPTVRFDPDAYKHQALMAEIQRRVEAQEEIDAANAKDGGLRGASAQESAHVIGNFMDQLSEQAMRGKMNFKQLVDSAIMDLTRWAMNIEEKQMLIPMLNRLFGAGTSATSGVQPNDYADVMSMSMGSGFHLAGGGDMDGGWAVVGDGGDGSGAELFAPKGPGTVLPHEVLEGMAANRGGGGAPNVTINTINNSSAQVQQRQGGISWDGEAKQFIIHTVLEDMNSGGPMSTAMSGFARS